MSTGNIIQIKNFIIALKSHQEKKTEECLNVAQRQLAVSKSHPQGVVGVIY